MNNKIQSGSGLSPIYGGGRYMIKKFVNFVRDLMTQHECVPQEGEKPGKQVCYSYTWNCTGTGSLQTWKRYYVNHVLFQTPHQQFITFQLKF